VQAADQPAALPLRLEGTAGEAFPVGHHLAGGQQGLAAFVEDHGREVVVEQHPLAIAVGAASEEDLEGVVAGDADAAAAVVAEQRLHLGDPLRMGGAAQAEAVGEQTGPVVAGAQVAAPGEALAPEVLGPLLAVEVVSVAPQPGGEGLVLVGLHFDAGDAAVKLRLGTLETVEGGTGEFAGIPGVVGTDLRIADPSPGGSRQEQNDNAAQKGEPMRGHSGHLRRMGHLDEMVTRCCQTPTSAGVREEPRP
jgi:hypothetical protein